MSWLRLGRASSGAKKFIEETTTKFKDDPDHVIIRNGPEAICVVPFRKEIGEAMGKKQREAPCIGCAMTPFKKPQVEGTLLMLEKALLFFVGQGSRKEDIIEYLPYKQIISYNSSREGGDGVPIFTVRFQAMELGHLQFRPGKDTPEEHLAQWAESVMVYLDLVITRRLMKVAEREFVTWEADRSEVSAEQQINDETLLCDTRAARNALGVSLQQRLLVGPRFPCEWVFKLKSTTEFETVPAVVIPGPSSFVVLLPQQKVFVPFYWKEILEGKPKRECFTMRHASSETSDLSSSGYYTYRFINKEFCSAMSSAFREARDASKSLLKDLTPVPKIYPPVNTSSAALASAVTAEEEEQVEKMALSIAEQRAALLKKTGKKEVSEQKKQAFTSRFLGAVMDTDLGDDSDDGADNAAFLDMLDNEEVEEVVVKEKKKKRVGGAQIAKE